MISLLHPASSLWTRLAWSIIAVTLVGVCIRWFANRGENAFARLPGSDLETTAEATAHATESLSAGRQIDYFAPLLLWSALASMVVVYMSNHRTGLLVVSLAPIWISIVALVVTNSFRDRPSAITITALCCASLGAWLGSDGDSAALLGFSWYAFAGYVVAQVFYDRRATISVDQAVTCTILWMLLTGLIMGSELLHAIRHPATCTRQGAPYFALEAYIAGAGRWMFALLRARFSRLRKDFPRRGLPA